MGNRGYKYPHLCVFLCGIGRFFEASLFAVLIICSSNVFGQAPATTGILSAIHDHIVSVKNDQGTIAIRVTAQTDIWRGGEVEFNQLHLGDHVLVSYRVAKNGEAVASDIVANVTRIEGVIVAVHPHSMELASEVLEGDNAGQVIGRETVFIDAHTKFIEGTRSELKAGKRLEAVGLDLGGQRMRATSLSVQDK